MKLTDIIAEAETAIAESKDPRALDEVRVRFLGKKGALTAQLKSLGALPADERPGGRCRNQRCQAECSGMARRAGDRAARRTAQCIARRQKRSTSRCRGAGNPAVDCIR